MMADSYRKNAFIRISLGDLVFQIGDGKLLEASVTLGEGSAQSNCRFSIRASKSLVDRFFTVIYKSGGLDPVIIPNSESKTGSNSNGSSRFSGDISSLNGVDPSKIKRAINFYLSKGLSIEGTAYLVGNYIQESSLDHQIVNDFGNTGLAQWDSNRQQFGGGIPLGDNDFENQLGWALEEMVSDGNLMGHNVRSALNGSDIQAIMSGLSAWERYGGNEQGSRYRYGAQLLEAIKAGSVEQKSASDSVKASQNPKKSENKTKKDNIFKDKDFTGAQITIELGFNSSVITAYSFLHTGINYNLATKVLEFEGTAATWILTQVIKNMAYKDTTLEAIALKICENYGLKLVYEAEEVSYKYFPQLGISDYECLLLECRRLGLRLTTLGSTLTIAPRVAKDAEKIGISDFVLKFGDNLISFEVNHKAGSTSGGARSSTPSEKTSTGETKYQIDPQSGILKQVRTEVTDSSKNNTEKNKITGYHTSVIKPVVEKEDTEKTAENRENELRIKGIAASFSCYCDNSSLLLTPDSVFRTEGISEFLDRVWVIDQVTHNFRGTGYTTEGSLYSPMKNKYPSTQSLSKKGALSSAKPNDKGWLNPHPTGVLTSPFGMRGGRLHGGIDLAGGNDPVYATRSGTVIDAENNCVLGDSGCGGGFGNLVYLDHGDGYVSRYAHLQQGSVQVSIGQSVSQGEQIGIADDTGASRGVHLHFEVLKNGERIDPLTVVTL